MVTLRSLKCTGDDNWDFTWFSSKLPSRQSKSGGDNRDFTCQSKSDDNQNFTWFLSKFPSKATTNFNTNATTMAQPDLSIQNTKAAAQPNTPTKKLVQNSLDGVLLSQRPGTKVNDDNSLIEYDP